jgi:hypothetical protein
MPLVEQDRPLAFEEPPRVGLRAAANNTIIRRFPLLLFALLERDGARERRRIGADPPIHAENTSKSRRGDSNP